jgi:hypothetical protein
MVLQPHRSHKTDLSNFLLLVIFVDTKLTAGSTINNITGFNSLRGIRRQSALAAQKTF